MANGDSHAKTFKGPEAFDQVVRYVADELERLQMQVNRRAQHMNRVREAVQQAQKDAKVKSLTPGERLVKVTMNNTFGDFISFEVIWAGDGRVHFKYPVEN
jgi:hypothetical protein